MQQHPVPQNVTGFQFKLIGDMTVKQFVFLAAGVLVAYFITRLGWPPVIKFPIAIAVFGGGFAFAFMPIEDRPLEVWVTSFFKNVYAPTVFLWKKSSDIPEVLQPAVTKIPINTSTKIVGGVSQETVTEYLRSLPNKEVSPLDEKEEQILKQISQHLKQEYGVLSAPSPAFSATQGLSGVIDRVVQETNNPSLATITSSSQKVMAVSSGNTTKVIPLVGRVKIRPLRQLFGSKKTEEPKLPEKKVEQKPIPQAVNINPAKITEEKTKAKTLENIVSQTAQNLTLEKNEPATVHVSLKSATKIADKSDNIEAKEGDLGELQEKINQLEKDLSTSVKSAVSKETEKNDQESVKLKDSLKIIEEKFAQALSEKQKIEDELSKIKKDNVVKKPDENVFVPNQMIEEEKKETATVKFVPNQMAAKIGVPQPTKANIVAGIVKDQTNDILPNVLIEIKDQKGKTERALKTNKLGQFSIATALDNGVYTIHFEDPTGLHEFDIIEITLDGKIFPAMEVKAKNQKDAEREKLKEALFGKNS